MFDFTSLGIGVASGLFCSFLLFIFRYGIAFVFSSLAGIFNRSLRGTWQTKFKKNDETFEEIARVKQLFSWVWGTIEYPNKGRKYDFKGNLKSNVLIALYEVSGHKKNSIIDRGSFTLSLNPHGDSNKLTGKYSWTDDDSIVPLGDEYEWHKKD